MDKLLTIVIPTYNMQDYLSRGLDSLIVPDQSLMEQLEVLVINDGSTDRSSEIAHGYEAKYPHTFRVIDKKNGHYGSCVNRGLKEATGKYIKILDADDWFDTANFEKFLHFLAETYVDLVVSEFDIVNEKEEIVSSHHFNIPENDWNLHNYELISDMWMHAVLYRRAIFEGLDYHQTEGIAYTDDEWIFLPMTRVHTIAYFNLSVYKYLVGREGQSVSDQARVRNMWQEMKSWKVELEELIALNKEAIGEAEDYLWCHLQKRAEPIYAWAILNYRAGYNEKELLEFDMYIRERCPQIYQNLDDVTSRSGLRFRYIHYWRKWKNRPLVAFIKKAESQIKRKCCGI